MTYENFNFRHDPLKHCPFCGHDVEGSFGEDTLYPNGAAWLWLDEDDHSLGRHYVRLSEAPEENWCYSVHCPTVYGGCGAEVSGDSQQEAENKWNRRDGPTVPLS